METMDRITNSGRFYRACVRLLGKLAALCLLAWALLSFVFGLTRVTGPEMEPAFGDGDLVLYERVGGAYAVGDVLVYARQDGLALGRVAALAGQTVDLTAAGLTVNGRAVSAASAQGETTAFEGGVVFPLTVGPGQVFVLGDDREHALDSRLAIVTFADSASTLAGLTPVDDAGHTSLRAIIDGLGARSSHTQTHTGIQQAEGLLTGGGYTYSGANAQRSKVVVVLTDGEPYNVTNPYFDTASANSAVQAAYRRELHALRRRGEGLDRPAARRCLYADGDRPARGHGGPHRR